MIFFKTTYYLLVTLYPFLISEKKYIWEEKGPQLLLYIEGVFLGYMIIEHLYSKMVFSRAKNNVYGGIKFIILGCLLCLIICLQFYFTFWQFVFSLLKNIGFCLFFLQYSSLKSQGMSEILLVILVLPSFYIEGNAIVSGHLNGNMLDLGPITFMYIILYLSWGSLPKIQDYNIRATGF